MRHQTCAVAQANIICVSTGTRHQIVQPNKQTVIVDIKQGLITTAATNNKQQTTTTATVEVTFEFFCFVVWHWWLLLCFIGGCCGSELAERQAICDFTTLLLLNGVKARSGPKALYRLLLTELLSAWMPDLRNHLFVRRLFL
jgi:hypothetical protein